MFVKDKSLSDQELIDNINNSVNENSSLIELADRHSGIFNKIVNAYSQSGNYFMNDFKEEKLSFVYEVAKDYQGDRGATFCTWLRNKTAWRCEYLKNKSRSDFSYDNDDWHEDYDLNFKFNDNLEILQSYHYLQDAIEEELDPFYTEIFDLKMKGYTWREIGEKNSRGVCYERCRQIFEIVKDKYKKRLKNEK